MMRITRGLWIFASSASLALLLALATPAVPSDVGGIAFAQGTGQPAPGQPSSGDQGPGVATETAAGAGQQAGTFQPVPGGAVIVGGPREAGRDAGIEEGDDIDEGLSNQRYDPDDD